MNEQSRIPTVRIQCVTPQGKQANTTQNAQRKALGLVLDESRMDRI